MQKSNTRFPHNYESLKNEKFKDHKNFETKKNDYYSVINDNSENSDQFDLALSWFSNKDYYSNQEDK